MNSIDNKPRIVVGNIEPIRASELRLHLPQFVAPPTIAQDRLDVRATEETIDAAISAARGVVAMMDQMPLNAASIDVLNMAFAVLHYASKDGRS